MAEEHRQQPGLPVGGGESTTALSHYFRAEMARMTSWRDRLDRTTNWAITVVAALLSVSLSTPSAHHGVLLFALLLISLLLYVEARRYRFYDVYRMRVRQSERHYFSSTFAGKSVDPGRAPWLDALADDLRHPRFRIGFGTALRRRLRRNYVWLYVILLLGWLLKVTSSLVSIEGAESDAPLSLPHILENAALGPLPGWSVVVLLAFGYGALLFAVVTGHRRADDDEVRV